MAGSSLQAPGFELSEQSLWPGCLEIEIEGELDLAVGDELRAALDRALERRLHVLVDLSALDPGPAEALAAVA